MSEERVNNLGVWHLVCLECGDPYSIDYLDIQAMPVEPLTHTIYSYCNKHRGRQIMRKYPDFRLKKCPFCGDEMEYVHEMHYNKNHKLLQAKYWLHSNEKSECVLDEIDMPFVIGAGDADPERNYVGEYGAKWNQRAGSEEMEKE